MPPDASKPADAGGVKVEPVAWRYHSSAPRAEWTVQKNRPTNAEKNWPGYTVEPLYPPAALQSLTAENARLTERAEAAEREAAEAAKALEDGLDIRMRHMHFGDGEFDMEVTGEAVNAVALAFVSNFKSSGTANYIEMNIFDRDEPFQRYTVTVQKIGALSPADKTKAAEASLTAAQQTIEQLTEALRPFAKAQQQVDRGGADNNRFIGADLTIGDLRRARAALSGEETK